MNDTSSPEHGATAPTSQQPDAGETRRGPSRRAVLGGAGVVAGAAALAGGGFAAGRATASPMQLRQYDFFGEHQSGIVTPAQDRMHFAAFDVTTSDRDALIGLLRAWSEAAATLMSGSELGTGIAGGSPLAPPEDTGDATGLPASGLTITFGFGPGLFVKDGVDRFGLAGRRPAALIDLPHFPGDTLQDRLTGGDLCIQACADDPQVAMHAIRNLSRLAFGVASVRWAQLGFGRTSSTTREQTTPRNLMGFKDGTRNLKAEDTENVREWLWADASDGADWMAGGTYLVARKLRILAEIWDRASLSEQEALVGRTKGSGAPLSGGNEFTDPDFTRPGADGSPLIPTDSHVALAHPSANGGAMMLRRGYNYTDGADDLGRLDAGLFFLAFVRDPETQFVPMQTAISSSDAMTVEYVRAVGSALFAVPPGVPAGATLDGSDGAYIGQGLFT
ncbi:iron uptake transporter deferrochelatase/peroxidase subunit [Demequina sp. NBRC 110052]|uniref:iron uptake transporter deferrochelatase/peroxidase subunit n=1 Tax=Demequina sp. NBRC 110052 TaxID=1570341 RepID=UPI000A037998|nr:iron uptake transporter deferrochelatase/peroxidase subunit [Demequina sp. NBRC 110052]